MAASISPGVAGISISIVPGGFVVSTGAGTPVAVFADTGSLLAAIGIWIVEHEKYQQQKGKVRFNG